MMKTGLNVILDPTRRSVDSLEFEAALWSRSVGQDAGIKSVVENAATSSREF